MKCEKCQDKGFTEQEHGLVMIFCDCEKGQAKRREVIGEGDHYTGILFQLAGKRTDEYSDDDLWMQAKEASLEKMEFPYTIAMPCGNTKDFDSPGSILNLPVEDIPCPCSNPNHFIVRFVDAREVKDDSSSRAGQPDKVVGSTDTSGPSKPKKQKARRKSAKGPR